MPSSMMANGKWKKTLFPSLGSRHRDRNLTDRSGLSASNTIADFSNTGAPKDTSTETNALLAPDEEIDDRVISALLDTTAESEPQGIFKSLTRRSHSKVANRSQTMGALRFHQNSSTPCLPSGATDIFMPQDPSIPTRTPEPKVFEPAQERYQSSSGHSGRGFLRPSTGSQTASSPRGARRLLQSTSTSALTSTILGKGGSPIRKSGSAANKLSRSVTSLLGSNALVPSKTVNIADAEDSGGRSKITRSRTKHVLSKFAGVITDTFTTKGNRKEDKSYDANNEATSTDEVKLPQIIHGLPLPRLELDPLPLSDKNASSSRHPYLHDNMNFETMRAPRMISRPARVGRGPLVARKRLTIVDEVRSQQGSPSDDPFSGSPSSHSSAESGEEFKHGNGSATNLADPFEAERLLDTNTDDILNTPPVGFSTPRRRSRTSWVRCPTPTRAPKAPSSDTSDLITFSDTGSPVKSDRRRKSSLLQGSPCRNSTQDGRADQENVHPDGRGLHDKDKGNKSRDSTRLSSYPPGSTIRHVPRSMGRLTDVPVLSAPDMQAHLVFPIAKKKHPSPSKMQLELYGQFMEKNLALGVFHDPDELGLSFDAPYTSPDMLTPRDTNRSMRGSGTTVSNFDMVKDFDGPGKRTVSQNTRSRIPLPAKKGFRSRTETTVARNFYPLNMCDMNTEDELQWDTSAYTIGRGCNHRCCGSKHTH